MLGDIIQQNVLNINIPTYQHADSLEEEGELLTCRLVFHPHRLKEPEPFHLFLAKAHPKYQWYPETCNFQLHYSSKYKREFQQVIASDNVASGPKSVSMSI